MEIHINHFAVIVCAIANLALGALWYSPAMFYHAWKKENGLTDEQLKKLNPPKVYGLSFILALLISYNMAFFWEMTKRIWHGVLRPDSWQGLGFQP